MQPLKRIGLARLVGLLICASEVVLAQVKYGCATSPQCPVKPAGFAGGVLKCNRCDVRVSIQSLMDKENKQHQQENQDLCQDMVNDRYDGDNTYKYYNTPESKIDECLTPSFLLYDGARECLAVRRTKNAGTITRAIRDCIGHLSGFYNCLCLNGIDNSHIQTLRPCFGGGNGGGKGPNMLEICSQNTNKPSLRFDAKHSSKNGQLNVPGNLRRGNRRSTVDDGSNTNSNTASNGGSSDGSTDGSIDDLDDGSDDDSSVEYYVDDWPPVLSDQFSPVLHDVGVSFYLDRYERIVLVNTTTMVVLYYEPYYLYTALSYDTVFPAGEDDSVAENLIRRCWLYPYSYRVWCHQWYMPTAELRKYGYKDSTTATILGPSAAASGITASTGDTAVPTAYTSVAYTTAGTVPSATTRTVTAAPATTTSPGSTAKPTKGSSSAPASRGGFKPWLAGILLAVLIYTL